jgi:hypothetical protein
MSTNKYWAGAKEAFHAGNRRWLPCPKRFYLDMLDIVPPVMMDFHPAFGNYFGNGEAWTHTSAGAIYLFFKEKPEPACRMATREEFIAELVALPLPGWQKVTEAEIQQALKAAGPLDYEKYQSDEYRLVFQGSALRTIYEQLVYIPTVGWWIQHQIPHHR